MSDFGHRSALLMVAKAHVVSCPKKLMLKIYPDGGVTQAYGGSTKSRDQKK